MVETVPADMKWCINNSYVLPDCTYATDFAAAQATTASFHSPGVWEITGCTGQGSCNATYTVNGVVVGTYTNWTFRQKPACPTPATNPTIPYNYNSTNNLCSRDVPCQAPDIVDPATGQCRHCPIDVLTELTDPVAIDFENGNRWRPDGLTADYQTKLTCVQNGITNRGGTYVGTSAYRPTQYQQHLFEIVQKDKQLFPRYMALHPECQALRDEITRAMGPHGLKRQQKVATPGTSRHESGTSFDVTPSGLTDAQLTSVYSECGVTHTAVPGEPWHVQ